MAKPQPRRPRTLKLREDFPKSATKIEVMHRLVHFVKGETKRVQLTDLEAASLSDRFTIDAPAVVVDAPVDAPVAIAEEASEETKRSSKKGRSLTPAEEGEV